jgi:hypothetical protein
VGVKFSAFRALLTVAQEPKILTVECCRVDADVGEAAILVGAAAVLEMLASGCIMSSRVVGKRASMPLGTIAFEQPALADGLLLWIMDMTTSTSTTYACVRVSRGQ